MPQQFGVGPTVNLLLEKRQIAQFDSTHTTTRPIRLRRMLAFSG